MGWMTPGLLTALGPVVAAIVGAVTRSSWQARKRVRQAVMRADSIEEWGFGVRHDARVYNASIPTDAKPFEVRPWPDWMTDDSPTD